MPEPRPSGAAYVVPAVLALVLSGLALAVALWLSVDAYRDPDPWNVGFVLAGLLAGPALAALALLGVAHRIRRDSLLASGLLAWFALAIIGLLGLTALPLLAPPS